MTDDDGDVPPGEAAGWFAGLDPDDAEAGSRAIVEGSAEAPRNWPALAVEAGVASDTEGYYEQLHEAAAQAAREAVSEREGADDRQLVHALGSKVYIGRFIPKYTSGSSGC